MKIKIHKCVVHTHMQIIGTIIILHSSLDPFHCDTFFQRYDFYFWLLFSHSIEISSEFFFLLIIFLQQLFLMAKIIWLSSSSLSMSVWRMTRWTIEFFVLFYETSRVSIIFIILVIVWSNYNFNRFFSFSLSLFWLMV